MRYTKWELVGPAEQRSLANSVCDLRCSYCDIYLATESDFAKHFVVTDPRYKNLGECPNKVAGLPKASLADFPKHSHGSIARDPK
jgi:hypothetical protein